MATINLLARCLRATRMKDTILGISVCFQCHAQKPRGSETLLLCIMQINNNCKLNFIIRLLLRYLSEYKLGIL